MRFPVPIDRGDDVSPSLESSRVLDRALVGGRHSEGASYSVAVFGALPSFAVKGAERGQGAMGHKTHHAARLGLDRDARSSEGHRRSRKQATSSQRCSFLPDVTTNQYRLMSIRSFLVQDHEAYVCTLRPATVAIRTERSTQGCRTRACDAHT